MKTRYSLINSQKDQCIQEEPDQIQDQQQKQNQCQNQDQDQQQNPEGKTKSCIFALSDDVRTRLVIFGFIGLVVLQLTTKKMDANPPSYYVEQFVTMTTNYFISFGNMMYNIFDIISGYLNIKDFALACHDLLWPLIWLSVSPYYVLKGLCAAASQEIQESGFIIMTGLIFMMMILTILEINTNGMFKPSFWIDKFKTFITTLYRYFGRFISDLSSVYRVLKLEQFVEALFTLLSPIHQIVAAPIASTFKGYFDEVNKYRYGGVFIIFGTITLISLTLYGCSSYFLKGW